MSFLEYELLEYELKASLERKTNALNRILDYALKINSDDFNFKEILKEAKYEYLNSKGWRNEVFYARMGCYYPDLWIDPLNSGPIVRYNKKLKIEEYEWPKAINTEEAFAIQRQRDIEQAKIEEERSLDNNRSMFLGILASRIHE